MHHVHPVVFSATQAEMDAIMEEMQIEDADQIELYRHPSIVVCPLCKESYETELDHPMLDTPEE